MSALDIFFELLNGDEDPFRQHPENLRELQLAAMRERFAKQRGKIKMLDKRATDTGVDSINKVEDMVPLLFAHQVYKSYPETFIDKERWSHLNTWLQTLSSQRINNPDLDHVRDVDDWIDRMRDVGHYIFSSSGTSGKCSFVSQTLRDLANVATSCVKLGIYGNETVKRNLGKTRVFEMMPPKGAHRHVEAVVRAADTLGRETVFMFDEPATANDSIRMGRMRRAIADGSAKPSEIAAFQAAAAEREKRTGAQIDTFLEKLMASNDEPVQIQGNWPMHWMLVEHGKNQGIPDGICHPDTVATMGGGLKGTSVPADYREQILHFYGIPEENMLTNYGMSEMIGTGPWSCKAEAYAICPWIVPLILDKRGEKLLNPADGKGRVEGRFAFFDLLAEGYWGGFITGDKAIVDFSTHGETDGFMGPLIRSVARYADLEEGEDKLSCAGTMESYVRGMVNV